MAPPIIAVPLGGLETCVRGGNWDSAEDTFRVLRRVILSSGDRDLELWALETRQLIWGFLLDFCRRRKIFKRQVVECLSVLTASAVWREDYTANPSLQASAAGLPDDVLAAIALQHDVLAQSFSAKSARNLKPETVPEDLRLEDVKDSVVAFREADRLRTAKLEECESVEPTPTHRGNSGDKSFGGNVDMGDTSVSLVGGYTPMGPGGTAAAAQLRDGVQAVLEVDTPEKMEDHGLRAFTKLRRGCLHTMHWPEALDAEAAQAAGVLNFLVDVAKQHRLRLKQVCEVVNLVMASEAWVEALRSSQEVMQRVRTELPEDAQAVIGLQHEELLGVISPAAAQQATAAMAEESASATAQAPSTGTIPASEPKGDAAASFAQELLDAREVAREMKSMRKCLQVDFLRSIEVRAIDKEGTPIEVTLAQKADLAVAAATEAAGKVTVAADWREARAPSGKKYYYHVVTRVSRWDKPKDIPLPTWEAGGFRIGDPVEVYSSSRKVWCKGLVESLTDSSAAVAYRLPGAAGSDLLRKELPFQHEDLRRRAAMFDEEEDSEEAPGPPAEFPNEEDDEESFLLAAMRPQTASAPTFRPPTAKHTPTGLQSAPVWSETESAVFWEHFQSAKGPGASENDSLDVKVVNRHLEQSGLQVAALKEA
eukprot:TRINITY_DN21746_c0_g1_i1.p1 TRINITY_DN21746_c0_g1~~TRINITY_DN21746_c0_g1_i1.p1  ORF type:complete len:675 (+),score=131.54 TRINITY_DN21746_c0_g1_i1:72-2027(+)